ncbi:MAG: bifunctional nuclease domain-containing protein [Bacteroidota bacterium]
MIKIQLDIVALSHSVTQSHNYAVVLGETGGQRRLPVVIGGFEAQAIAVAMEQMAPNRPLTHDLFKNTLETFDIDLREVVINNLLDGVFYAKLICDKDGTEYEIDSRTSDAIALAVRFDCPIYTYEFIMDSAGVVLEESGDDSSKAENSDGASTGDYKTMTEEALNGLLKDVIANEDYERAAKIRDELLKRKSE